MEEVLESLPVVKFFKKCKKCGATDWSSCNLDASNHVVTDCNKCPGRPEDWSPLDEVRLKV